MSTNTTQALVSAKESKLMEYVPFGSQDKIKLSIELVKNLIAVKTKSGKTCSDQDALKFMMMCQAKRLNPYEQDAYLIGFDGKDGPVFTIITAHQAFLKRAEVHPEFDGMKSGIIIQRNEEIIDIEGDFYLDNDKVMGGWATVFFKNRKQPMHRRIRLKRFQKSFGVWQEDPAGMVCKCAEADALRSSFPTMLGGLYLKEEMHESGSAKVSSPIFNTTVKVDDPPAKPVIAEPEKTSIEKVRELCKRDGVAEYDLVGYMASIGMAEDDSQNLDAVPEDYLAVVLEQWQEYSERSKQKEAHAKN